MNKFFACLLALAFMLAPSVHAVAADETVSSAPDALVVPGARDNTDLPWASDGEANVPYVFHDPEHESRMTGFEYDLVNAIAEKMHRKARFIQNDWDGLIPGLSRDLYSMVADGIEMTPEHKAAVLFSRPY